MPYRPKRPCSYPGCPRLTDGRYCEEHKKLMDARYDSKLRNKGGAEFYHSKAWRRKRQDFLIENPFCVECRKHGRLTKATIVDHIVPIMMGGPVLDDSNLQSLCASCHGRKSIEEGSRFRKK
ncbi:MAG: HNH endonuclease [Spirochaetia bacterium]|nr:HNH endonuclease [Spirochaetia bacterium]